MIETKRRQLLVLIATILGSSIVILDGTIVTLALPKIAVQLHAGFSALQWIVDGYTLALSALILLGGSLGDILGRKRVYVAGLISFGAASLLCAVAPNATMLVIFRILQGIGGALMVPGALSIINTNFPRAIRGKAIGQWTAWGSVAPVLGPLLGGLILDATTWRWIFLINVPLLVVCGLLAMSSIVESKDESPRHIDGYGAAIGAVALAALTFGLIQGPVEHWGILSVAALVVGVFASVLFVWFESKTRDPMVRLSLFKSRNFTGSNFMTFAMYGALSGFFFALVIYLQTHMGYSSLKAGFSSLPVSIIMFLFAGKAGSLSAKYGARMFMTVGPLLAAVGIGWLYFLRPGDSYAFGVFPGILLFSIGLATTVAPLTMTVMASVSDAQSGIASGINNAVSRAAGLIVIATLGLFGSAHIYAFAVVLCAGLAACAGVLSFILIRKPPAVDETDIMPHLT